MSPTLSALAAAAGCGALIGSIRQWSEQTRSNIEPADFSGVRTHTLWAMLGCIAVGFPWALPAVIALVAGHLITQRWTQEVKHPAGGTSLAAALITVLVGALIGTENPRAAVLATILTAVLLGLKQPIHDWTRRFTTADIRAALQFAAITGIVLPLVPNRDFGPFDAFNPYTTWLMVVLISGLGFVGYVAMRLLGARAGLLITSLFGGLASSTASTLAFSKRSREEPALSADYAFAAVASSTVMLPRTLAVIFVISPELALACTPGFALMTIPALAYGLWHWLSQRRDNAAVSSPSIANPLGLGTAIKFALLYAGIVLLVKAASALEWEAGILPLSFISGLTNMDAIALSMADSLADEAIAPKLAAQAVILGAVANSLLKAGLAASLGTSILRNRVAFVLLATAAVGVGAMLFA